MSNSHEIITIQAGNFANFIGTHWWNIQESSFCYTPDNEALLDINHDVMFCEGSNSRGEVTFTPRLVLIDLEDNLTSMRKVCPLYRTESDESREVLWDGQVDVIEAPPSKKNPYLEELETAPKASTSQSDTSASDAKLPPSIDFDSSSTVWCDFLKTNLHPRSFCLLKELSSPLEKDPLDVYSCGEEMYSKSGRETVEENIRRMTQECDYLQGFHFLLDAHNGFAGISGQILQHLDDEYKGKPSICFPVFQSYKETVIQDIPQQMHRLYAILNCMGEMNNYSSFFSPLSLSEDIVKLTKPYKRFPYLDYNENLMYHTSAIFSASIDTLTSPYRLRRMKFSAGDISSSMSTYGRKLVCSSICLPFPLSHDAYLSAMIEKDVPEFYMSSLTPFYKPDSERSLFQTSVLRGVPGNKFQNLGKSMYQVMEHEEIFGQYLNKYSPSSVTTATVFSEKCSVSEPFPSIFKNAVSESGLLNDLVALNGRGVSKVPVAASLCSSDSAGNFIGDLLSQASTSSFKEFVKRTETTYEKDNYLEVIENLIGLQDNYQHY